MAKVKIETERLVLRQFRLSDAKDYFEMTRDSAIKEYIPYGLPNSKKHAQELIKESYSQYEYYLVLESKETHKFVGTIMAILNEDSEYDLCLMIVSEQRGKGYLTEAIKAFIKTFPSGTVLAWEIRNDNEASLRAVYKIENVYEVDSIFNVKGYEKYYFREFRYTVQ